nr:hypothetical protein [Streptomyces adustus]
MEEPQWCGGHADHNPETARADLTHTGPAIACSYFGWDILGAEIVQHPFSTPSAPELGSATPGVSVYPLDLTLSPVQLYSLAAALDRFSDQLRALADQLTTLTSSDGGDR